MTPKAGSLSWECIKTVCEEVLSSQSCELWGDFKKEVAKRLDVAVELLKPWKGQMQDIIRGYDDGGQDGSQGGSANDSGEHSDGERQSRIPRSTGGDGDPGAITKRRKNDVEDTEAMKAFKQMVRAMSLGPRIFRGLKDMKTVEAEDTLRQRLREAGAEFKHSFPSPREINKAREKSARDKDLEGIDTSNILEGSRRRGRLEPSPPPPKRGRRDEEPDEDSSSGSEDASASEGGSEAELEFT